MTLTAATSSVKLRFMVEMTNERETLRVLEREIAWLSAGGEKISGYREWRKS